MNRACVAGYGVGGRVDRGHCDRERCPCDSGGHCGHPEVLHPAGYIETAAGLRGERCARARAGDGNRHCCKICVQCAAIRREAAEACHAARGGLRERAAERARAAVSKRHRNAVDRVGVVGRTGIGVGLQHLNRGRGGDGRTYDRVGWLLYECDRCVVGLHRAGIDARVARVESRVAGVGVGVAALVNGDAGGEIRCQAVADGRAARQRNHGLRRAAIVAESSEVDVRAVLRVAVPHADKIAVNNARGRIGVASCVVASPEIVVQVILAAAIDRVSSNDVVGEVQSILTVDAATAAAEAVAGVAVVGGVSNHCAAIHRYLAGAVAVVVDCPAIAIAVIERGVLVERAVGYRRRAAAVKVGVVDGAAIAA